MQSAADLLRGDRVPSDHSPVHHTAPAVLGERERAAVNELFDFFARCFRHLWARDHADEKARYAWAIALKTAKVTPAQVRVGLAKASQLKAPPTVGEFIAMCRPHLPDAGAALQEAAAWWRGDPAGDAWSHPTVGVAAAEIGPWPVKNLTQREMEHRWRAAYDRAQARFFAGETLQPPALRLLTEDRGQTLPGPRSPLSPETRAKIAALRAEMGLEPLS